MHPFLEQHRSAISALCAKHGVERLFIFGSAVGKEFDPARSDVDFVVRFRPHERSGWDDVYFKMLADLEQLLGPKIDLIEGGAIESPYFIAAINRTKELMYAA